MSYLRSFRSYLQSHSLWLNPVSIIQLSTCTQKHTLFYRQILLIFIHKKRVNFYFFWSCLSVVIRSVATKKCGPGRLSHFAVYHMDTNKIHTSHKPTKSLAYISIQCRRLSILISDFYQVFKQLMDAHKHGKKEKFSINSFSLFVNLKSKLK